MSLSFHQWKMIHLWLVSGALCGLLWGGSVALLMTLTHGELSLMALGLTTVLSRTQIGALAGCFFGALAALILACERLQLAPETMNGKSALLLFGAFVVWCAAGLLLYQTVLAWLLTLVDWQHMARQHVQLLRLVMLGVIFLALPPFYNGGLERKNEINGDLKKLNLARRIR